MKIIGSFCILAAGVLAYLLRRSAYAGRMAILRDLTLALRQAEEEIRAFQTPLPHLFCRIARGKCEAVSTLFSLAAREMERGESMDGAWRQDVSDLCVPKCVKETLFDLPQCLRSGEENACKGIILATERIQKTIDEETAARAEREKRELAVCFSGAALLVILLV